MKTKAYIKYIVDGKNREKNKCLVEVEVMGKEKAFGRELCVVRPISGEGHIRLNCDSVIVKK